MTDDIELELRRRYREEEDALSAEAAAEIRELRIRISTLKKAGENLYLALLESECSCPKSHPCACSREKAMDKWHDLWRKNQPSILL